MSAPLKESVEKPSYGKSKSITTSDQILVSVQMKNNIDRWCTLLGDDEDEDPLSPKPPLAPRKSATSAKKSSKREAPVPIVQRKSSTAREGKYEYASSDPNNKCSVPQLLNDILSSDHKKVTGALSALSLLCDEDNKHEERNRKDICRLGGPTAIVSLMRKSADHPSILAECCGLIQNLAAVPDTRDLLTSVGAIQAVVAAMKKTPCDVGIQEWGCGALNNMVWESPANQALAIKSGAIPPIVEAMVRHTDYYSVQESALCTLSLFFGRDKKTRDIMINSGALAAISNVATAQQRSPAVKKVYIDTTGELLQALMDMSTKPKKGRAKSRRSAKKKDKGDNGYRNRSTLLCYEEMEDWLDRLDDGGKKMISALFTEEDWKSDWLDRLEDF